MVHSGFVYRLHGCLQIRSGIQGALAKLLQRRYPIRGIVGSSDIELLHRCAIVQQHEELNLGCTQVYGSRLQIGFVLYALQFQAVEIYLGDVAEFLAVAADLEHLVVIRQVFSRQRKDRLLLQGLHKGASQIEKKAALLVGELRVRDGCGLPGAVPSQFALVLPLVKIIDRAGRQRISKRGVGISARTIQRGLFGERIDLVEQAGNVGIGPEISGDLFRLGFVNANPAGHHRWIVRFKPAAELSPGEGWLGKTAPGEDGGQKYVSATSSQDSSRPAWVVACFRHRCCYNSITL